MRPFDLDSIFYGAPNSKLRKPIIWFAKREKFKSFVVPFTGRFAAAGTLILAGIQPSQVYTSDIGLFSSVLGHWLSEKPLDELRIEIKAEELAFLPKSNDTELATSVMFALKYHQLNKANYFIESVRREFIQHWQTYYNHIKARLEAHADMKGLHYEIMDVFDEIKRWDDHEDAFMYLNPPIYKKGYSKMFNTQDMIAWRKPNIPEFSIDNFNQLLEVTSGIKATTLVMAHDYSASHNIEEVPSGWFKVFANQSEGRLSYYVCNKDLESTITRTITKPPDRIFPIHTDDDPITKSSHITIMKVRDNEAKYYRDLFIHRLGTTDAELHFGLFVDGKLMTAFGINSADSLSLGKLRKISLENIGYIFENYGITAPSKLNKNRLFMALLISQDFKRWADTNITMGLGDFTGIRTTCLTRIPENRILHGLYKCVQHERLKNGSWHLTYQAIFNTKSFKSTIVEWLDQQAKKQRNNTKNWVTSDPPSSSLGSTSTI